METVLGDKNYSFMRKGGKTVGFTEKKKEIAKKMPWEAAKKITKGVHQLGLKDEPRHKTLDGKEVKY